MIFILKGTYRKENGRRKRETLIKRSPARFYLNPEALWVSGHHHHDYWPLYLMFFPSPSVNTLHFHNISSTHLSAKRHIRWTTLHTQTQTLETSKMPDEEDQILCDPNILAPAKLGCLQRRAFLWVTRCFLHNVELIKRSQSSERPKERHSIISVSMRVLPLLEYSSGS